MNPMMALFLSADEYRFLIFSQRRPVTFSLGYTSYQDQIRNLLVLGLTYFVCFDSILQTMHYVMDAIPKGTHSTRITQTFHQRLPRKSFPQCIVVVNYRNSPSKWLRNSYIGDWITYLS